MSTVLEALRRLIRPGRAPAVAAPEPKPTEAERADMLLAAFPKCC
ncbi:hypothetical protein PSA7680_00864 [Pseudoruegeria aquimaris]|uniref:Uncharacterized protein n=1 Tax=Pseudoruegeria aquimaris TaxID=393663 RepID=A0A1Y5RPP3_9RHOB|nr:hypothetical protein [Pseudoruegeria aquimaris]SLN22159.1 hypothetical protein PSA7680_00864 [Pseudoruegeria aquimaris]